ncbi:MAG: TetR/AcrR family transcriptional regulator [Planctomycetota bacterium]|nr:TetR/AcrR family transcriptional regulator [Planctomycetota bacterium]
MTESAPTIRWVTPKQPRSQETLERLAQATMQLLEEKSFEQISIEEIAKRAGSSVGGFYARFPDKEALYEYLYVQYEGELAATRSEMFDPTRWLDVPLQPRVEAIIVLCLNVIKQRAGFFRTMALRVHMNHTPQIDEQTARRGEMIESIRNILLECRNEITHPDPVLATKMGFYQLLMAIQERYMFPHTAHTKILNVSDDVFMRELVRAFLAYVGASYTPSPEMQHVASRS